MEKESKMKKEKEYTLEESFAYIKSIPADQPINEVFWFERGEDEDDTETSNAETDSR